MAKRAGIVCPPDDSTKAVCFGIKRSFTDSDQSTEFIFRQTKSLAEVLESSFWNTYNEEVRSGVMVGEPSETYTEYVRVA